MHCGGTQKSIACTRQHRARAAWPCGRMHKKGKNTDPKKDARGGLRSPSACADARYTTLNYTTILHYRWASQSSVRSTDVRSEGRSREEKWSARNRRRSRLEWGFRLDWNRFQRRATKTDGKICWRVVPRPADTADFRSSLRRRSRLCCPPRGRSGSHPSSPPPPWPSSRCRWPGGGHR